MLDWRLVNTHFILVIILMLWSSGKILPMDITTKAFNSGVTEMQSPSTVSEEQSATDITAKVLLFDELMSLENDVIETKKKRSFSGFGSPLDRLSAGSIDHKGKQSLDSTGFKVFALHATDPFDSRTAYALPQHYQKSLLCKESEIVPELHSVTQNLPTNRKVVNHPKRRFGIPMDRIGRNRLSNSRG